MLHGLRLRRQQRREQRESQERRERWSDPRKPCLLPCLWSLSGPSPFQDESTRDTRTREGNKVLSRFLVQQQRCSSEGEWRTKREAGLSPPSSIETSCSTSAVSDGCTVDAAVKQCLRPLTASPLTARVAGQQPEPQANLPCFLLVSSLGEGRLRDLLLVTLTPHPQSLSCHASPCLETHARRATAATMEPSST